MAGTLTISTLSDGTNSTSATNPIRGSAKAWVNFNGTGVVAIRGSYNVSSITDNGTGYYTVNLTNAVANANYCVATSTQYYNSYGSGIWGRAASANNFSTTSFTLSTGTVNVGEDEEVVCAALFSS